MFLELKNSRHVSLFKITSCITLKERKRDVCEGEKRGESGRERERESGKREKNSIGFTSPARLNTIDPKKSPFGEILLD